jgi:phosphate uptake regulator
MLNSERKLQGIGSSILVSLPSEWVKSNSLKKGDTVSIETSNDNSITIVPKQAKKGVLKEVIISLKDLPSEKLVNQIYGYYLLGYEIIQISGKSPINYDTRDRIKSSISKLVGLEIVDEDNLNITVQFLLDAHSMEVSKILRRMSSIIGGMHRDTISSLIKGNEMTTKLIRQRDDEVDRQYFLIVRLMRSAMMDRKLASSLNLSNIDLLDYRIAANHMESAGDHISSLASFMHPFQDDPYIIEQIKSANLIISQMHEQSVKGFIERDIDSSMQVIRLYSEFNKVLKVVNDYYITRRMTRLNSVISTVNATSTMDKLARCWVDIADLIKPMYGVE